MADSSQLSRSLPMPPGDADDRSMGGLHRFAELVRSNAPDADLADSLCRAARSAVEADWAQLGDGGDGRPLGADGEPVPVDGRSTARPLIEVAVESSAGARPVLAVGREGAAAPFTDQEARAVTACAVTAALILVAAGRSLPSGAADRSDRTTGDPLVDLPDGELWDLFESAPDAMLMTDPDGRLAVVNRQTETMFGYRREELLGQPVEMLIPDRFHTSHVANRKAYRARPSNRPMGIGLDLVGRRADGSEFPVEVSLSPARRPGATGQVVVAVRDVTTRTEIETRLHETQLRFRAAFDDGPVPMALVDITPPADRIIVEANQAMADLVGYDRQQLLGMSFADLTHPEDQPRDEEAAKNHLCGDNSRYSPVKRYVRSDGSVVWVQLHASPLLRRDGGTLCIAHAIDITERVEATAIAERHEALDAAVSDIRLAMLRGASREQGLALITRSAASCLGARTAIILARGGGGDAGGEQVARGGEGTGRPLPPLRCQNGVIGEVFRSGRARLHDPSDLADSGLVAASVGSGESDSVVVAPMHDGHETVGVLLVVRDRGVGPLDSTDLTHIERFASEAVIAIELADVAEAHQRLELLEDRERIGRDMHDKVIGRLFATGMSLQAMASLLDGDGRQRALAAVEEIDATIGEIRAAIYGIRSQVDWGKGVRGEILALAAGQRDALGFEPEVTFQGDFAGIDRPIIDDLLATLREALANAAKYASADRVQISVSAAGGVIELTVADDGIGFDPAPADTGPGDAHGRGDERPASPLVSHGLKNMVARAERRGGTANVLSAPQQGTTVHWRIPLGGDLGA